MQYRRIRWLYRKLIERTLSRKEWNEFLRESKDEEAGIELSNLIKERLEKGLSQRAKAHQDQPDESIIEDIIATATQAKGQDAAQVKRTSYFWIKVAAAILLLMVAGYLVYQFQPTDPEAVYLTKTTASGQKSTITLSDGTTVRLNSESKLVYPEMFVGDTRQVVLEGEGFFQVKKDSRPFLVKAGRLQVKVLGTSFNVNAYDPATQIAVAEGKVEVSLDSATERSKVLLTGNELVTYDETVGSFSKERLDDINHLFAWKDGILWINQERLREAVPKMERWYGTHIHLAEQLEDCLLEIKIRGESLEEVLELIKYAKSDLSWEFTDEGVFVEGEGCVKE